MKLVNKKILDMHERSTDSQRKGEHVPFGETAVENADYGNGSCSAMPEGVTKKCLRAENVMTWLWMEQLCSSIEAESKYIPFQEQEKTGATRTEGNQELHTE